MSQRVQVQLTPLHVVLSFTVCQCPRECRSNLRHYMLCFILHSVPMSQRVQVQLTPLHVVLSFTVCQCPRECRSNLRHYMLCFILHSVPMSQRVQVQLTSLHVHVVFYPSQCANVPESAGPTYVTTCCVLSFTVCQCPRECRSNLRHYMYMLCFILHSVPMSQRVQVQLTPLHLVFYPSQCANVPESAGPTYVTTCCVLSFPVCQCPRECRSNLRHYMLCFILHSVPMSQRVQVQLTSLHVVFYPSQCANVLESAGPTYVTTCCVLSFTVCQCPRECRSNLRHYMYMLCFILPSVPMSQRVQVQLTSLHVVFYPSQCANVPESAGPTYATTCCFILHSVPMSQRVQVQLTSLHLVFYPSQCANVPESAGPTYVTTCCVLSFPVCQCPRECRSNLRHYMLCFILPSVPMSQRVQVQLTPLHLVFYPSQCANVLESAGPTYATTSCVLSFPVCQCPRECRSNLRHYILCFILPSVPMSQRVQVQLTSLHVHVVFYPSQCANVPESAGPTYVTTCTCCVLSFTVCQCPRECRSNLRHYMYMLCFIFPSVPMSQRVQVQLTPLHVHVVFYPSQCTNVPESAGPTYATTCTCCVLSFPVYQCPRECRSNLRHYILCFILPSVPMS